MTDDPGTMYNRELVKAYSRAQTRQSEINQEMINDGFGRLKLSEMRINPDVHPLAREFMALIDECYRLGLEADLRYGPGLILIEHLLDALGPNYRRIKGGSNA